MEPKYDTINSNGVSYRTKLTPNQSYLLQQGHIILFFKFTRPVIDKRMLLPQWLFVYHRILVQPFVDLNPCRKTCQKWGKRILVSHEKFIMDHR